MLQKQWQLCQRSRTQANYRLSLWLPPPAPQRVTVPEEGLGTDERARVRGVAVANWAERAQ